MTSESSVLADIRLACSRDDVRLWRNNVGRLQDARGRWVSFGVCSPGGSDLIGWKSVVITPAMVGMRLAVFSAIETKATNGRLTPEQLVFIEAVKAWGGIAGVAKSVEEAKAILCIPYTDN